MSQINYTNKYISNKMLEWLIEEGKVNDSVFFKGETGDRYSIYVFTKMNKNTIPQAVLTIADYSYKSAFVADQEVNMVACLTELMMECEFN